MKRIIPTIPISSTRYSFFIILVQLETSSYLRLLRSKLSQRTSRLEKILRIVIVIKDKFGIMKYKKGSIVEVLIRDEVPYHSWRCAQIVSGNGHHYTVRYDVYPGFTNEEKVERVSRKFMRPCPPAVEISECWPGDVVEVFHNLSWKMAIVSKAIRRDLFLVRLAGSFLEFEASKSEIRVRQSWQNDEWVVIGKVHMNSEDGQCRKLSKHNLNSVSHEKKRDPKGDLVMKSFQFCAQNDNLQESHIVSTRTLKRGSPCCVSQDEVNGGTAQKFRLTQKEGKRLLFVVTSSERVDAVPNSREMACASSTGSCTINSYSHNDMECESGGFEDIEGHDSDAESVCQTGYEEDRDLYKKDLAEELHSLELQAYRRTIEALHASGPLSWEKESMAQSWRLVRWGIGRVRSGA